MLSRSRQSRIHPLSRRERNKGISIPFGDSVSRHAVVRQFSVSEHWAAGDQQFPELVVVGVFHIYSFDLKAVAANQIDNLVGLVICH